MSFATVEKFDKATRLGTLIPIDSASPLVFRSTARDFETDEMVIFDESTWATNVQPAPVRDGSMLSALDVPNDAAKAVQRFDPAYFGQI